MTEVYSLFVCCDCGMLTYQICVDDKCCFHTVGFNQTKKITSEFLEAAPRWAESFKKLHEKKQ